MRIGVDGACLANGRGYGRFTRELLRALLVAAREHRFVVYGDRESLAAAELAAPNVDIVHVPQSVAPANAAAADGYRSPVDMLRLTRAVWRDRPDVFWSPSVYTYFPLPPGLPALVTIHDTITERFPELTMPTHRARLFWNAKVRLALWQATLVLTVSEFAANEIEEILGVSRAKLRVAGEAAAPAFRPGSMAEARAVARDAGVPDDAPWFTYVGGFTPHKYVDRIVRAHAVLVAEAAEAGKPAPYLVLVGTTSADNFHGVGSGIHEAIADCGTADLIRWTGFLPDETLRHLLTGASALLLPSENEGFGLPAVEAAACGAPVVATTASPLPQLLEGGDTSSRPVTPPPSSRPCARCSTRASASVSARSLSSARHVSPGAPAPTPRSLHSTTSWPSGAVLHPCPPSRDAPPVLYGHHVLSAAKLRR